MTVTRLWAQKHPKCFDPENDILLLDFQLQKTEATELLRNYFEYWEDDDYNRMVIEVVGGAYPHFDMWHDEIDATASELDLEIDLDDEGAWSCHPLLKEMIDLQHRIESQVEKSGGELFMEVE
jgi:hypothetical protein